MCLQTQEWWQRCNHLCTDMGKARLYELRFPPIRPSKLVAKTCVYSSSASPVCAAWCRAVLPLNASKQKLTTSFAKQRWRKNAALRFQRK